MKGGLKMKRFSILLLLVASVIITACGSTTESINKSTTPPKISQPTSEVVKVIQPTVTPTPVPASKPIPVSTPAPASASPTQNIEKPVAALGEPITSFDAVYGEPNADVAVFHRYKDDYLLIIPMNDLAWNISIQFEATTVKNRTREEALEIAKEFIPSDAIEVKEYQVEEGKDVIVYESASLAKKFDKEIFRENKPGTFIVMLKSDKNGVYTVITAPGNNP